MAETASQPSTAKREEWLVSLLATLRVVKGRPVPAIQLARALGLTYSHETNRRRVREVVEAARELGFRVCANGDGYWEARDAGEWLRYRDTRKRGAVFAFAELRRMQEAATDRISGQGKLFETQGVFY